MKDVLVSGEVLLTEDWLGVGAVVFDAHGGRLQSHLVIGDLEIVDRIPASQLDAHGNCERCLGRIDALHRIARRGQLTGGDAGLFIRALLSHTALCSNESQSHQASRNHLLQNGCSF